MNWRWIDKQALLLLHEESLSRHGGISGLRDEGLLDSALHRPLNLQAYGKPDVAELAATYGYGLAKNHPFSDGNKRAAFLGVGLFLALNGYRLNVSQHEATEIILSLAAGELTSEQLADWIRKHIVPRVS